MSFSFSETFAINCLSTAFGSLLVSDVSDDAKFIIRGQLQDIEGALSNSCESDDCGDDDE